MGCAVATAAKFEHLEIAFVGSENVRMRFADDPVADDPVRVLRVTWF
jgi:hypothetical protein